MPTEIGETLRTARRRRGATLADAAAETRVRESYLAALEEEDYAALGGDVYVRGFLRSYARFLGLDPEPLLAAHRRDYERDDAPTLSHTPAQPVLRERQPGWGLVVIAAVIVLVVLVFFGLARTGDSPEPVGAPVPVPASAGATVPDTASTTVPDSRSPSSAPAAPGDDPQRERARAELVEVAVTTEGGPSWLRVLVDGVKRFEGRQPASTTTTYRGERQVELRVGDPGAVRIVVNGEDQGRIGAPGVPVDLVYRAEPA